MILAATLYCFLAYVSAVPVCSLTYDGCQQLKRARLSEGLTGACLPIGPKEERR